MPKPQDTPRYYAPSITTSRYMTIQEEKADDIINKVQKELEYHIRCCDTDVFLKEILPVDDKTIRHVSKSIQTHSSGHWAGFPLSAKTAEKQYYDPFVSAANSICAAISKDIGLKGEWVNRASKSPSSSITESAKTRPDCLFVSRPSAIEHAEEKLGRLGQLQEDLTKEQKRKNKKEVKEQLSIWWRQIHVLVEVKNSHTQEDFVEAMWQTCGYLRQVLREQLDRRFAIALVLCHDQLTILLSDRSGVLFTKDPIDIHRDFSKFIHIIAAFSALQPWQIGWDPHMKVYDPESRKSHPSYLVGDDTRLFKPDLSETHWEIDIPSKDGGREKVITLVALSINQAEVMRGRATLVWEAIRKQAIGTDEIQIFVVKRYWRPYDPEQAGSLSYLPEGDRYRRVPSWEERIYSCEDIKINDTPDSTLEFVRRGLKTQCPQRPDSTSKKRPLRDENRREHHDATESKEKSEKDLLYSCSDETEPATSRVHTQVIHTYTGWSLRHFKDLKELLGVISDIVKEHKQLYYKGLILHRDISIGNILIVDSDGQTKGRLIDLDHAKVVKSPTTVKLRDASLGDIETMEHHLSALPIERDVIKKFVDYFPVKNTLNAAIYIQEVVYMRGEYFGLETETRRISLADIGWDKEILDPPDFSDHQPQKGELTGTLPFISVEALKGAFYTIKQSGKRNNRSHRDWFHDAVHDMESLFWVLMYICLTRRGPGAGMWREELLQDASNKDEELEKLLNLNFDNKDQHIILTNKSNLINPSEPFMEDAIKKFHPYFENLKSLTTQWWSILIAALEERKIEYYTIHDQILSILDNVISSLPPESDEYVPFTKKEIERREAVRDERLRLFRPGAGEGKTVDLQAFGSPERAVFVQAPPNQSNKFSTEPESPTPRHKKQRREHGN